MNRVLVLGGAGCVWDDIAALREVVCRDWPWTVVAVNDIAVDYEGRVDHFVTLHPEKLSEIVEKVGPARREVSTPGWLEARHRAGRNLDFVVWGGSWVTGRDDSLFPFVDRAPEVDCVGSSGYHAIGIALRELEADRVVAAGIPMDTSAHYFDDKPWGWAAIGHRPCFESAVEPWDGRVRFLSGWTADLFGVPDREWLGLDV